MVDNSTSLSKPVSSRFFVIGQSGQAFSSRSEAPSQGFPILKDRAMPSEESLDGLIDASIEKASLPSTILNPEAIHQA
jgi:hypothetical protein